MERTVGVMWGRVRLLALLLVVSVWAITASVAPMPASAQPIKQVRILAPAQGSLFAGGKLRVVASAPAKGFRAWLGTKEITKSFARRGKRRVALIDRSRLRAGVEHLYVKAGGRKGSFDSVRFVVARRKAPGLLDATGPRLNGRMGPASVTANRPVRASMRAYLNGRRLRGEFEHRAPAKPPPR